jgi:hypothetical protein
LAIQRVNVVQEVSFENTSKIPDLKQVSIFVFRSPRHPVSEQNRGLRKAEATLGRSPAMWTIFRPHRKLRLRRYGWQALASRQYNTRRAGGPNTGGTSTDSTSMMAVGGTFRPLALSTAPTTSRPSGPDNSEFLRSFGTRQRERPANAGLRKGLPPIPARRSRLRSSPRVVRKRR